MIVEVEESQSPGIDPCAFFLGERRIGIKEIIDRWPSVECTYFKVQADDGAIYILRYAENGGPWEIVLFQSPDSHAAEAVRAHW